MKYQFISSDFKQRFAERGEIQSQIAAIVGMDRFDIEGHSIAVEGKDSRLRIPQGWHNTIMIDLANHCFEVKPDEEEGQETRSQKIERLCHVIAYGKFQERPAANHLIISPELSLTFANDRGSITVSAMYNGNFCYDIFTENEQESLHDAFETFKANKAKKEKDDFFMNVKF